MSFKHIDVHDWAQKALDKYNGGYSASDVISNAVVYLYRLRDDGNSDTALAVASHYLHCRYITSMYYILGWEIDANLVLAYDGILKLIEKYSSIELAHKFGKIPASSFSPGMIAWDMQGLSDGMDDFKFCWGNANLYAPYQPLSMYYFHRPRAA
ncbi:MAG TPA: hypothetical protein VFV58_15035 [Blastocatellia bacterium]|jgi:hypothetical protein|nr:hypothetical protein [Blastocatellia bacterium]